MEYIKPEIALVSDAVGGVLGTFSKSPSWSCDTCSYPNLVTLPAYEADE